MYPFGSGMPQGGPPYNPAMNNASSVPFGAGRWAEQSQNPHPNSYQSDQPGSVPFGAGRWVQPGQSPYTSQQSGPPLAAAYPPQNPYTSQPSQPQYSSQVPYPSLNPYTSTSPYPPSTVYASSSPYPTTCPFPSQISNSSQSHYSTVQTPYPTGNSYQPQPSSCPYPGNQYQSPQHQSPYPPSSTTSSYSSQNAIPYPASSPYPSGNPYKTATYSVAQTSSYPQGSSTSVQRKGTPTVVPAPDFDPVKDASALRKAMRGFGTDEDGLINVICRRTNAQRQEIQRQYKTHFGKDLIEDVVSETSGNFQKVLVGLLLPIVDFYVKELNDAMAGIGTDEDVLIEVLCTLSNAEIHTIKHVYTRTYGRDLESELKSETSGNFKRLLVSLCAGARDESGRVDLESAQNDARDLLNAGELRFGTDESTFNMVLCQRNFQQLRLVFQEYQKLTGHSLEKAIKREFSGDIEDGLLAIFRCVMDKAEFFATRLHKSMAGIGTNDKQLIRIIVTRCEIDMQDIKQAFERLYGKSLKSWVKGDTSGHYKHALYPLIGEERSS